MVRPTFEIISDQIGGVRAVAESEFDALLGNRSVGDLLKHEVRGELNRNLASRLADRYGGAGAVIYTQHSAGRYRAHVKVRFAMGARVQVINVYVSKKGDGFYLTNIGDGGWINWAVHCNNGTRRNGQTITQV